MTEAKGLSYSDLATHIATMAVVEPENEAFVEILPQAVKYAENRICRDLDFLFTSISWTQSKLTAGNRSITLPAGTFVVTNQINVVTPFNAPSVEAGTRNPLLAVSRDFLDATCGSPTTPGLPRYFAPFGNTDGDLVYLVGPYPDADYLLEITGTIRPETLSVTQTPTFISTYLSDLLIMATMVYISGYQRNFGATAANDPQMPVSYESQYQALLMGAMQEEARKKFEAAAWSSRPVSPVATPTRG